jgi:hypothetical protein
MFYVDLVRQYLSPYPGGEEGGNFLVQMIFPASLRLEGGGGGTNPLVRFGANPTPFF